VLSPLLFLIYINDLVEMLPKSVGVALLADDVALWGVSHGVDGDTQLQKGLFFTKHWAIGSKAHFGKVKSQLVCFHNKKSWPVLQTLTSWGLLSSALTPTSIWA
jgi:hypothetical protein